MFTADEIRAAIALAGSTGLTEVPERIRTLAARVEGHATAVAVVGMVKRGKSTLFNRLVGVEVSAVSATPETAATIQVMTGPPNAWGRTKDGVYVDLPPEPARFMEQLRRRNENKFISAGISGNFRMPEGLILIDTPGVGDVATELKDDLARLDEQWLEAGAGAALVVLSPAFDSRDRALVEKAQRAFPGAVEVVLKPTSRDTSNEEVIELANWVQSDIGIRVTPMVDAVPSGQWGTDGEFASLEMMLVDLSERAEARLDVDLERFQSFLDLLCSELRTTDLIELPILLAQQKIPALPTILRTELDQSVTRLSQLKQQLDDAAELEIKSARAAEANIRARSLIRLYETTAEDWPEQISVIKHLAECATDGSDESARWLGGLIGSPHWPSTLTLRRKFLNAAIAGVSDTPLETVIERSPITIDDLDHLLRNKPNRRLRQVLERIAPSRVAGAPSQKIRAVAQVIEDSTLRSKLNTLADTTLASEQEKAVHMSIQKLRGLQIGDLRSSRLALQSAVAETQRLLGVSNAVGSESLLNLRESARETEQDRWNSLGEACIRTLRVWFETFPSNKEAVNFRLSTILDEADVIAAKVGRNRIGDRLRTIKDATRWSGSAWVADVVAKAEVAQSAVEKRQSRQKIGFSLSLLGMFYFAFACRYTPLFMIAAIGAFVAALMFRSGMSSVSSWQNLMSSVPYPPEIAALGSDAPKKLNLPPVTAESENSPATMGGCGLTALVTICAVIALFASIAYMSNQSSQQESSRGSYSSRGTNSPTATRPPSSSTTLARTSTSTSSTSSTTSTTIGSTSTSRVNRSVPTELSSDFAYEPDKCGVDSSIKSYPHSPTRTYEVTATIGLWRAPTTSSSQIGVIGVTSYGRGGIGCASGSGPEVTVSCQLEGEAITGPFGTDTTWLKVRIDGYTGYVTDHWVDTQWDVYTDTIPYC